MSVYRPVFGKAYATLATNGFLWIVDVDLWGGCEQGGREMDLDDESEDKEDSNGDIKISSDISVSLDEGGEDTNLVGLMKKDIISFWKRSRVKLVHDCWLPCFVKFQHHRECEGRCSTGSLASVIPVSD